MRRKKQSRSRSQKRGVRTTTASESPPKIKYEPLENEADMAALTVREKDVLYWVVRGKENADIAGILRASPDTIRKHVENIRRKFGSESRLGVIASYWQRQIDRRDRRIEELEHKQKT
jgi:DNA-binding CsgD family transcriptional regulator